MKPPFRPLLHVEADPLAPPPVPKQPHFAPLDDPYATTPAALTTGPSGKGWNSLSPGTQKLVFAGMVAVMALGLGVYKFRPKAAPLVVTAPALSPEPEATPEGS